MLDPQLTSPSGDLLSPHHPMSSDAPALQLARVGRSGQFADLCQHGSDGQAVGSVGLSSETPTSHVSEHSHQQAPDNRVCLERASPAESAYPLRHTCTVAPRPRAPSAESCASHYSRLGQFHNAGSSSTESRAGSQTPDAACNNSHPSLRSLDKFDLDRELLRRDVSSNALLGRNGSSLSAHSSTSSCSVGSPLHITVHATRPRPPSPSTMSSPLRSNCEAHPTLTPTRPMVHHLPHRQQPVVPVLAPTQRSASSQPVRRAGRPHVASTDDDWMAEVTLEQKMAQQRGYSGTSRSSTPTERREQHPVVNDVAALIEHIRRSKAH